MFIPANFAIGALVGVAATCVYKNETAKEALSGLGTKVKDGVDSTLGLFKKKTEEEVAASEETVVAEKEAVETVTEEVTAKDEKSDKA